MSTETLTPPQIQNVNTEILNSENYLTSDQTWITSISKVQLQGISSLKCFVERPDSGPAVGGYLMLYLNEISVDAEPVIRQYFSGQGNFEAEIGSDDVDFTKHNYVLAYAPFYSAPDRMVVASVKILFGSPINLELSACTSISHETRSVTSYYKFDSNPLGFGYYNSWIVIKEGGVLGEGRQVGIATIDPNDPSQGIKVLQLNESLKRGQTYNVYTTIFSTVRPVAGYTFTTAR